MLTGEKWLKLILAFHLIPVQTVRYLLENECIRVDQGDPFSLLSIYSGFYSQPHIDLLLDEFGSNINIQNAGGVTPLYTLVSYSYDIDTEFAFSCNDSWYEKANSRIECFLERGADPLLTKKDGVSTLDYVRSMPRLEESYRTRLISILERYA